MSQVSLDLDIQLQSLGSFNRHIGGIFKDHTSDFQGTTLSSALFWVVSQSTLRSHLLPPPSSQLCLLLPHSVLTPGHLTDLLSIISHNHLHPDLRYSRLLRRPWLLATEKNCLLFPSSCFSLPLRQNCSLWFIISVNSSADIRFREARRFGRSEILDTSFSRGEPGKQKQD